MPLTVTFLIGSELSFFLSLNVIYIILIIFQYKWVRMEELFSSLSTYCSNWGYDLRLWQVNSIIIFFIPLFVNVAVLQLPSAVCEHASNAQKKVFIYKTWNQVISKCLFFKWKEKFPIILFLPAYLIAYKWKYWVRFIFNINCYSWKKNSYIRIQVPRSLVSIFIQFAMSLI